MSLRMSPAANSQPTFPTQLRATASEALDNDQAGVRYDDLGPGGLPLDHEGEHDHGKLIDLIDWEDADTFSPLPQSPGSFGATSLVGTVISETNFDVGVTVIDTIGGVTQDVLDLFASITETAMNEWSRFLGAAEGASIEVAVNVGGTNAVASAGPATIQIDDIFDTNGSGAVDDGDLILAIAGTLRELQTGEDPNGAAPDLIVNVNEDLLADGAFFFDPELDDEVPAGAIDFYSVMLHELGHGLGFFGFGDVPGQFEEINQNIGNGTTFNVATAWDLLIEFAEDGTPVFTGENAVAAYGEPVPIEFNEGPGSDNAHVLGTERADGSRTDLAFALMNPFVIRSDRVDIGDLELAIMADIGHTVEQFTGQLVNTFDPLPDSGTQRVSVLSDFTIEDGQILVSVAMDRPTLFNTVPSSVAVTLSGSTGEPVTSRLQFFPGEEVQFVGADIAALFGDAVAQPGGLRLDGDLVVTLSNPAQALLANGAQTQTFTLPVDALIADGSGEELVADSNEGVTILGDNTDDILIGGAGNDTIDGGAGNDDQQGGGGEDVLLGRAGDDLLEGGAGADRLDGGAGVDTASYASASGGVNANLLDGSRNTGDAAGDTYISIQNLTGTAGNDDLRGDDGANTLVGGAGNDTLAGGDEDDLVFGGDGDDRIVWNIGEGSDQMNGGAGNDTVEVNAADGLGDEFTILENGGGVFFQRTNFSVFQLNIQEVEVLEVNGRGGDDILDASGLAADLISLDLNGGEGNDTLRGGEGADTLRGGDGDDTLRGGEGADTLNGGAGEDIASYADASQTLRVDLGNAAFNNGIAAGDSFAGIEGLTGSGEADDLRGDALDNRLEGGRGNDFLTGRSGDDALIGGDGDDALTGGLGADALFGGAGTDRARYADATSGVTADLQNAAFNAGVFAAGDSYSEITDLVGSQFSDSLRGDESGNRLTAGDGDDFIAGRNGDDTLSGGDGDDMLSGGGGADVHNGGNGIDQASYIGDTSGVTADLEFSQFNTGIAAGDTYINVENLRGANADDDLRGDAGDNKVEGFGGNDVINGRDGNDELRGGVGNDTLIGGAGDDLLVGSSGNDVYRFNAPSEGVDTIQDMISGVDTIQFNDAGFTALSAGVLDAANLRAGTEALDADDFVIYDSATGNLFYDADGAGGDAQVQIASILNTPTLDQDDFFVF